MYKQLVSIFYRFFLIILTAFSFDVILNKLRFELIFNLFENIVFAIVLIIPFSFITKQQFRRIYSAIALVFFSFCLYFESGYYYLFKTYFSSSSIFIFLDSNLDEALEFLSFYLDTSLIIFTIIFLIVTIGLTYKIKKDIINLQLKVFKKSIFFRGVVLIFAIIAFLKFSRLIIYNLPSLIVKSSIEYYKESEKFGTYQENVNGNFNNVYRPQNDESEVYVIVLGESTSRSHLGIYNYYRETTPELNKLKDELLIYNDVISPHAYSVGALTKILTLGNYEHPEGVFQGSIVQLVNSAGFETYWLSNQRPIGPYESLITKISLSAKNYKFLTTTIAGNSKILDEELLPEFDEALQEISNKKVIFLHLMGTHHHYENRYTEKFNKFNDKPLTNFLSGESKKKINHYDNAILYNDYIISQVIKKVDSLNKKSFVLYFSDHGEEMFDDMNMAGHNEDIYSKKMFEVPFFIWQSKKFKKDKQLLFYEDRKYMLDDLFHSFSDLLDISAKEVDSTRSIFNKNYKDRKRIIKDTIDFDLFFD